MPPTQRALEIATELGFDLVGVAPLAPAPDAQRYAPWVEAGHHGELAYLERAQGPIADPAGHFTGGRSLLMVGLGHSRAALELAGGARVARYAAGRDYHNLMGKLLKRLGRALVAEGLIEHSRGRVDATPILERSHAEAAGLGFSSKAANLLHPRFGPYFFLGELILDVELDPTPAPRPMGSCGSCTACLDACPTDAILAPGVVDGPRCISFQTIEQRGAIPHELRASMGAWAFGCDVCSEVCPWARKAPDLAERFGLHASLDPEQNPGGLLDWLTAPADPGAFAARFQGSPLRRPGRAGLARNAAVVLGNQPSEAGREALQLALAQDPDPVVREAAAWGLLQGHAADEGVRAHLERALTREPDTDALAGMRLSLKQS
ncbi:MAG: epoxyqueuosine reductase [Planctomycetota bacterium]